MKVEAQLSPSLCSFFAQSLIFQSFIAKSSLKNYFYFTNAQLVEKVQTDDPRLPEKKTGEGGRGAQNSSF